MAVSSPELVVSLSAVQAFQHCQQQYAYRYIERLHRRDRAVPLELGSILHDYLAEYYTCLQRGERPDEAHNVAQLAISVKYAKDIKTYANVALAAGHEDTAKELLEIPAKASRISERYFKARGKDDAEQYDVLLVEKALDIPLTKRIGNTGRLDLLTQDRNSGLIHLWDHKSTSNEPPLSYRLRDLQTLLYRHMVEQLLDTEVDAIMWNYLRTKEPHVPELLKKGDALSKRMDIDSTYEVYMAELEFFGFNPAEYADILSRLENRELTVFFPRYDQVIVTDQEIMLRDYKQWALAIQRERKAWESGKRVPMRTLSQGCDWCEYKDLCMAVLVTGDDSDIRELRYRGPNGD